METRRPRVVLELQRQETLDDLSPYVGKWVALRDGHFVAASYSLKRLLKDKKVSQTDTLVAVQRPGMQLYAVA